MLKFMRVGASLAKPRVGLSLQVLAALRAFRSIPRANSQYKIQGGTYGAQLTPIYINTTNRKLLTE